MHKLRPTLWRTCRVIACETRLKLLWTLFEEKELCVKDLAGCLEIGEAQASLQLRALNARGLIQSRREKNWVLYSPEANESVDCAVDLLKGLRQCHDRGMALTTVIRQATAFTHQRRIEVVRVLQMKELGWEALLETTGMSSSALFLHLNKLIDRGFVSTCLDKYKVTRPNNRFGNLLLRIAVS